MVSRESVARALHGGTRAARQLVAEQLARDLDAATETTQRVRISRLLLGALRDLDAFDRAARRSGPGPAERAPRTATAGATDPVDELRQQRERRKHGA